MLIIPPYLNKNDVIGITCPASKIELSSALFAADVLNKWGFQVKLGTTVGTNYHNFSAPDEERLADLQQMLDDKNIKAILFGRGGYGMVRLIDQLNFSQFIKHPKWICGFSDITILHTHIHEQYHIATMHSMMCSGINPLTEEDEYVESLLLALTGKNYAYDFLPHPLSRNGSCKGELIGGNLSLLANASGTISQPNTHGKILFIEDVGEYRYNIDRMLYNLKRSNWLSGLAGLLVGSFADSKETDTPFGQTEYEIIWDKVKEYHYPVALGFPCGHQRENYTLKLGTKHELILENRKGILKSC